MEGIKKYDKEYKVQAVKLAKEIGNKKAAQELGVPYNTLSGWIRKAKDGEIDLGQGSRTPDSAISIAEELQQLKKQIKELTKENKRLKEENEFLAEASAFFAASRQKTARTRD